MKYIECIDIYGFFFRTNKTQFHRKRYHIKHDLEAIWTEGTMDNSYGLQIYCRIPLHGNL
jgi:hypothetical protein